METGLEAAAGMRGGWSWLVAGGDAVAVEEAPTVLAATQEHRLIWTGVPWPAWEAMRSLRGRVNAGVFLGAAAECLLFLGARVEREFGFQSDGALWRVELLFSETTRQQNDGTPATWNRAYRAEAVTGEHWLEVFDEAGAKPYRTGDFAELFQFELS
jgi:hypothetical protein